MKRIFFLIFIFFLPILGFTQQRSAIKIIGGIPVAERNELYQIQVGAFRIARNAERAFEKLMYASLYPTYEKYQNLTRVLVNDINVRDLPLYIEKLQNAGFTEIFIRTYTSDSAETALPAGIAALPSASLREIGYRTVRVGETRDLKDIAAGKNVVSWASSTPSTVSVDPYGNVTGLRIGNGFISINPGEYISVVVVPQEIFYVVPEADTALLPPESRAGDFSTENLTEYRTEPTYRLAYRFNNKGEYKGASGPNGGIDILARSSNYQWLWTSYEQGGWFYDLNGTRREMINGYQKDAGNGVELMVKPEFVYDNGVPYLQLKHALHNPGNNPVTGQNFGASADVMIHENDYASLVNTPYGAYMTDSEANPSLELMLVCNSGNGITPVDTLWLGEYSDGKHLDHIYDDERYDVHNADSAVGFSYQNIDLAPGETKEFIVRFTLARNEGNF